MPNTWPITGSSRGLWPALARVVLEGGDSLLATARRPEQLAELVDGYGDRVRVVALDVTDEAAAQHAVQTAVESFGRLDVVVNNAGYANSAPVEETSMEEFRSQIEANLFGVINVTKAAYRRSCAHNTRGTSCRSPQSAVVWAAPRGWRLTRPPSSESSKASRWRSATRSRRSASG